MSRKLHALLSCSSPSISHKPRLPLSWAINFSLQPDICVNEEWSGTSVRSIVVMADLSWGTASALVCVLHNPPTPCCLLFARHPQNGAQMQRGSILNCSLVSSDIVFQESVCTIYLGILDSEVWDIPPRRSDLLPYGVT